LEGWDLQGCRDVFHFPLEKRSAEIKEFRDAVGGNEVRMEDVDRVDQEGHVSCIHILEYKACIGGGIGDGKEEQ
jgi:hypothetical protein